MHLFGLQTPKFSRGGIPTPLAPKELCSEVW